MLSIFPKANAYKQRQNIRKDVLISIRKVQSPTKLENGSKVPISSFRAKFSGMSI